MTENKKDIIFRVIFALLLIAYLAIMIKITFFGRREGFGEQVLRLKPFGAFTDYREGHKSFTAVILNYIGNAVLFFPLGIILPAVFKKLGFLGTVITGMLMSLAVETMQYFTLRGFADIDDLLMNTLGVILGAVLYFFIFAGGKRKTVSFILSLITLLGAGAGGAAYVWYKTPWELPESMLVINGMIAGRRLDGFDLRINCYKMSKGEIFIRNGNVETADGEKVAEDKKTYFISDIAVCIKEYPETGKYRITDLDEMIKEVDESMDRWVRVWLDKDGVCSIIMLENMQ